MMKNKEQLMIYNKDFFVLYYCSNISEYQPNEPPVCNKPANRK